jgi:hypothetical protein
MLTIVHNRILVQTTGESNRENQTIANEHRLSYEQIGKWYEKEMRVTNPKKATRGPVNWPSI